MTFGDNDLIDFIPTTRPSKLPSYRDLWKLALTRERFELSCWFFIWKHIWIIRFREMLFLDATSHLYKMVCPSVHWSICRLVRQSVRRLVRLSVHHAFVKNWENYTFLHDSLLQPIRNADKWLTKHGTLKIQRK